MIANGLNGMALDSNARRNYTKIVGGIEATWSGSDALTAGVQLPPEVADELKRAKSAYFDPNYTTLRDRRWSQS
jgi:hypothetical protein